MEWLTPQKGGDSLAVSLRKRHDQLVRTREDYVSGMFVSEGDVQGCFKVEDRVLVAARVVDVENQRERDAWYYGEIEEWLSSEECWSVRLYDGRYDLRFDVLQRIAVMGADIGAAIIEEAEVFCRDSFKSQLQALVGDDGSLLAGAVVLVGSAEFNERGAPYIGTVIARGDAPGTVKVLFVEDGNAVVCYDVALDSISRVVDAAGLESIDAELHSDAAAALEHAPKALNITSPRAVAEPDTNYKGSTKRRRINPRRAQQERDEERERKRVRSCFEHLGTDRERRQYKARLCKRCAPRAYVRIEASRRGDKEYYSATPKRGYKPRGNAPYLRCYHVEMNTESGSLLLDNEKRNQDYQRQYDAIGGV